MGVSIPRPPRCERDPGAATGNTRQQIAAHDHTRHSDVAPCCRVSSHSRLTEQTIVRTRQTESPRRVRRPAPVGASGEVSDSEPADTHEFLGVSRHQPQLVFNGRGSDQGIRETQSELSRDSTSPFSHGAVNEELAKWGEQFGRQVRRCIAREELRSTDHRVVQSVTARPELSGTTEVVDEDVCVDEKVSHAANCHAPERRRRVGHRTFEPERRRYRRHRASRRRAPCERPLPSAPPPPRSRRRCGGAARL